MALHPGDRRGETETRAAGFQKIEPFIEGARALSADCYHLLAAVFLQSGADGTFARTSPAGAMVRWVLVPPSVHLILYFI